jgi:hypothetical protein
LVNESSGDDETGDLGESQQRYDDPGEPQPVADGGSAEDGDGDREGEGKHDGLESGAGDEELPEEKEEPPPPEPFPITPFVPSVFVGTLCTFIGRQFAVPPSEERLPRGDVGEVPPFVQADGPLTESKYKKLQRELSKVAMAKQPIFMSYQVG